LVNIKHGCRQVGGVELANAFVIQSQGECKVILKRVIRYSSHWLFMQLSQQLLLSLESGLSRNVL